MNKFERYFWRVVSLPIVALVFATVFVFCMVMAGLEWIGHHANDLPLTEWLDRKISKAWTKEPR